MALEEYKRKRDFKKTPEPAPGPIAPHSKQLSYFIQKHDATRLHYDFRLELDGVLLSWAVTKGPSLNPSDKRLAVRTEDHPLNYGTFEGTIPKGQYGGGTVMLWDEGTWEPKSDAHDGLAKGRLPFILHGQRLKGGWDLIRMRGNGKRENWLLIKERDSEARQDTNGDFLEKNAVSASSLRSMNEIAEGKRLGARVLAPKPAAAKTSVRNAASGLKALTERFPDVELATLVDKPPEGDEWFHEVKFDGYRLLGFVSGGEVSLRTRNGQEWTAKFPALVQALENLKAESAALDMEAVVLDSEGKSDFQALQAALGEGGRRDQILGFAFDLLYLDGKDLTTRPLGERKALLEALLRRSKGSGVIRYSGHVEGGGQAMFDKACQMGLEGIVSKQADSPYLPGRQRSWLKIKCGRRQEFIILGYSDSRSGGRALGALYLGYHPPGSNKIKYAGKVGTGFTMKSARTLIERLAPLSLKKPVLDRVEFAGVPAREWQSIHWVKPELLAEVAFTEWTNEGQLRHPSFQGLREDKDAAEVKKEQPLPSSGMSPPIATAKQRRTLVLHGINITHPDRVISEIGNVTKGDLAEYYTAVAPLMLPSIARHPVSLLRCPSGIDRPCFYQRNPGKNLGPDVHPFNFKHGGKTNQYLYIEDVPGLLELVQMGAVEIHPWGASIDAIDCPDRLIFDLDPAPEVPFDALKVAAKDLRHRLKRKGLEANLKCTGGKGLHVTVPLAAKDEWPQVKSFGAAMAEEMVKAAPEAYIATMSKSKRAGKIFIDYFRNDYTATAIADYAVRARPGAPVALPLDWKELDRVEAPNQFTMRDVLDRVSRGRVPSRSAKSKQRIPRR